MDLSKKDVKSALSEFLNEKKLSRGLTNQVIADRSGLSDKTVARYLSEDGKGMPDGAIPDTTYRDLLQVLNTSHEEFKQYYLDNSQQNRTFNISGNASFTNSPTLTGNENTVVYNQTSHDDNES